MQHRCNMMMASLTNGKSKLTEKTKIKTNSPVLVTSPLVPSKSSVFQVSFSGSLKTLLIIFNSENTIFQIAEVFCEIL